MIQGYHHRWGVPTCSKVMSPCFCRLLRTRYGPSKTRPASGNKTKPSPVLQIPSEKAFGVGLDNLEGPVIPSEEVLGAIWSSRAQETLFVGSGRSFFAWLFLGNSQVFTPPVFTGTSPGPP